MQDRRLLYGRWSLQGRWFPQQWEEGPAQASPSLPTSRAPCHVTGLRVEAMKVPTSSGPTRPGRCHQPGWGTAHGGPGPREGLCPPAQHHPQHRGDINIPGVPAPSASWDFGAVLVTSFPPCLAAALGAWGDTKTRRAPSTVPGQVPDPALGTWHPRVPWGGGSQPQLSLGATSPRCVCPKPFPASPSPPAAAPHPGTSLGAHVPHPAPCLEGGNPKQPLLWQPTPPGRDPAAEQLGWTRYLR